MSLRPDRSHIDRAICYLGDYEREQAERELSALRTAACAAPGEVPGVDLHRQRVETEARLAAIAECVAAVRGLHDATHDPLARGALREAVRMLEEKTR